MFCKSSAVVALMAVGTVTLFADGQQEKQSHSVKGVITKTDQVRKCVTLKTGDGEKEYSLADQILVVFSTGQKMQVSLKHDAQEEMLPAVERQAMQVLLYVLRKGNEVELVMGGKDKAVTEVHFDNTWDSARTQR